MMDNNNCRSLIINVLRGGGSISSKRHFVNRAAPFARATAGFSKGGRAVKISRIRAFNTGRADEHKISRNWNRGSKWGKL
jgi:hypothetical protein